jgi:hypothetical protein
LSLYTSDTTLKFFLDCKEIYSVLVDILLGFAWAYFLFVSNKQNKICVEIIYVYYKSIGLLEQRMKVISNGKHTVIVNRIFLDYQHWQLIKNY